MELKAVFVGINKYRDPVIPELSGARCDDVAFFQAVRFVLAKHAEAEAP